MPALSFFALIFVYCLNGNLLMCVLWSTPAPFLANNSTQWRVLALWEIECELCFAGRWRWPLGLSGRWILWAGRLGFVGLRLWEGWCPRCLCQSIIFHRMDQPNHQCEQPVGHAHGDSNKKYFLLVRHTWIYTDKIYAQNVCNVEPGCVNWRLLKLQFNVCTQHVCLCSTVWQLSLRVFCTEVNAKFVHDPDPHHILIVCLVNSLCENLNGLLWAVWEIRG